MCILISSPSSLFFLRSGLQLMRFPPLSFHRRDAHHGIRWSIALHPSMMTFSRSGILKIRPRKVSVYTHFKTLFKDKQESLRQGATMQDRTRVHRRVPPVIRTPYLSMRQHNYRNKKPHTQGMPEVQRLPKHPPKSLNTSLYQKSSAPRKALKRRYFYVTVDSS